MIALKPTDMQQWRAVKHRRPGQQWLGHLLWYTVGEIDLTMAQLTACFTKVGLDPATIPVIHPAHAFQRATAGLQQLQIAHEDGTFTNLLIRSVRDSGQAVTRMMIEERVDAANEQLSYEQVAKLEWDAQTPQEVRTTVMGPASELALAKLAGLAARFAQAQQSYNGRAIRQMVTDVLESGHPISVRRAGGVYFVPFARKHTVEVVQALLVALQEASTHEATVAYAVPVVKAVEQIVMIKRAAQDDLGAEVAALNEKLTAWITDNKKVPQHAINRAVMEVRRLQSRVREYEAIVQDRLGDLGVRTDHLKMLMMAAFNLTDA